MDIIDSKQGFQIAEGEGFSVATDTSTSVPAALHFAARLSFAAAATFVVLLAALHLIKPELDPSWGFISEYAIGDNGWIMRKV